MPQSTPDQLVRLDGIGKDYPILRTGSGRLRTIYELLTGQAVHDYYRALDAIDLVVRRGESLGIIGENGAGKSTLLKVIAGVVKATRGSVQVTGRVSALLELGTGFHPEYSGRDNIFLASALMGRTRGETAARLDSILAFADIGTHIDQPVKTYSSGMIVRLGFAVATALSPDLLVTDEVLAVGDESFQRKCLRWMEDFRANGGTLILCSHSMYHVQSLCSQTVWIHGGRVHRLGETFEVTQAYLAHHEAKNRREEPAPSINDGAPFPLVQSLWAENPQGDVQDAFAMGEELVFCGTYTSPDDQSTVIMIGVTRIDGTPVFGAFSNDAGYTSQRLEPGLFAFSVAFPSLALLPGRYQFRAHTLDAPGLRLFDTRETTITITGKTREHGFVRLQHNWIAGHRHPRPQ